EHRVMLEDRRLLELAPDARVGDLRLGKAREVDGLAEESAPRIRPRLAGDHVHHRRLAGAIRADDAAQFARVDGERKVVQGLEAVEADADALEVEDDAVGEVESCPGHVTAACPGIGANGNRMHRYARHCFFHLLKSPETPWGRKSVTRM